MANRSQFLESFSKKFKTSKRDRGAESRRNGPDEREMARKQGRQQKMSRYAVDED